VAVEGVGPGPVEGLGQVQEQVLWVWGILLPVAVLLAVLRLKDREASNENEEASCPRHRNPGDLDRNRVDRKASFHDGDIPHMAR
jgi:hypothetical protein